MNIIPTKPPLPEDECVGEVNKTLHLSRFKLLISEGQKVAQELTEVFARSSWPIEYGTYYCLLRFTYYSDAPDSPDGLLSDLRSLWNCHYILQSSIVDELESELEAMQDERRESVECMRLMRLIINHAKHEYCDQLILCE